MGPRCLRLLHMCVLDGDVCVMCAGHACVIHAGRHETAAAAKARAWRPLIRAA